jgi:hypothetical protein
MTLDQIDADLIEPDRLAECVIDTLKSERRRPPRDGRQRGISAREALIALKFEATFVWVCAANLRAGTELVDDDFDRLVVACQRIDTIVEEAAR